MTHLSEGALRRALDEPAAVSDAEREHVASCTHCRGEADSARSDRDVSAGLFGSESAGDLNRDADAAWIELVDRLRVADPQHDRPAVTVPQPRQPRRFTVRRPMAIVAAVAVLAVGSTAAAAAGDFLQVFRPRTVTPVSFSFTDLSGLPDLAAYGTLSTPSGFDPHPVSSAAAAQRETGIAAASVASLPRGVTGKPTYAVLPTGSATFTFSVAKAKAAAARQGKALPAMPQGMDGSKLKLDLGPGVLSIWGQSSNVPALAVVRMKAPTASAEGVPVATLKAYLLAQPGIPAGLATQLRALPTDGSVLPIPVPNGVLTSKSTTIGAAPATVLRMQDGSGAGVVWIDHGTLTAVVGLISEDEAVDVARGLH